MEQANPEQIKSGSSHLSHHLSVIASAVARLRADAFALEQALQEHAPELCESFQRHQKTEAYQAILNAASFQIAKISDL
jgi:hypothetical protein